MNKTILKAIQKHAQMEYPRECCGVLIATGKTGRKIRYIPCQNIAADNASFEIKPQDYADAEDKGIVIGMVHSHPDESNRPSEGDLICCKDSGVPWYIIAVTKDWVDDVLNCIEPDNYKAPLIGRFFYHGKQDCYTLVQHFYEREMGIILPNFERKDGWWKEGLNLYMDNFAKAGFRRLSEDEMKQPLQFGDVILMQVYTSPVANHSGVFIGDVDTLDGKPIRPTPNAFIHHMHGCSSEHTVYGPPWSDSAVAVVRFMKPCFSTGDDKEAIMPIKCGSDGRYLLDAQRCVFI